MLDDLSSEVLVLRGATVIQRWTKLLPIDVNAVKP